MILRRENIDFSIFMELFAGIFLDFDLRRKFNVKLQ